MIQMQRGKVYVSSSANSECQQALRYLYDEIEALEYKVDDLEDKIYNLEQKSGKN